MKYIVFGVLISSSIFSAVALKEKEKEHDHAIPLVITAALKQYLHLEHDGTRITKVTKRGDEVTCECFMLAGEGLKMSPKRGNAYFKMVSHLSDSPNQHHRVVPVVPSLASQNVNHPQLEAARRFDGMNALIQVTDEKEKD